MPEQAEEMLTPRQVAVALGISINYVYMLVRAERVHATKIDGLWKIPLSEVIAYRESIGGSTELNEYRHSF